MKKKISILGLHLNYGGVESSIINQANMLSKDYDVTLVITYKMREKAAFKIDNRVKIIYLTNLLPNKQEFLKKLKKFRLISAFFEGLKSLKVLYLKNKTMENYIKNTDADILISSRIEFTNMLSKYGKNAILIAEEHRHHNNNQKYINRLIKSCRNINYLISVSNELNDFYGKILPNTKCVYIPNALDYWPEESSKLTNKNLISIGRLSKEKGFLDLIETFKIIHDIDPQFHLDLVGDGVEYNNIKNRIEELDLQDNITLHGFQSKENINKLLLKSSIYLMTSFEESFGIVLIEAGSFGVPSIAFSSAQGARQIIKNNESGYLIANRDKEKMAHKVIELYNDKKKLQEFGRASKNIAQNFSFSNIKIKWLEFLKGVKK
jgi:N-acetylglucosaminyldiphosphoundecaprenol N-acetyl-beta-D-mannosaminyltransferase